MRGEAGRQFGIVHALAEEKRKMQLEIDRYREALIRVYRGDGRIDPKIEDLMRIAKEALEGERG